MRHRISALCLISLIFLLGCSSRAEDTAMPAPSSGKITPITKSDAEWKAQLTELQYKVLREAGTERAFTSPLNQEKRRGTFVCAGCDLPLFSSETKFESGSGWPSFWQPIDRTHVVDQRDFAYGMVRTENVCARCGGHLGHVFDDGPRPTGLRFCINGAALKFVPADTPKQP